MKRILPVLVILLSLLSLSLSACGNDVNDQIQAQSQSANDESTAQDESETEQADDSEQAAYMEKSIKYLMLLGLDENCSFELRDSVPTGVGDDKSYLLNVTDISEDKFTEIKSALESNGFSIVSDIMEDTERQARSYPYSNGNDLYIEIVFSYGANYFDVMFTPIYHN